MNPPNGRRTEKALPLNNQQIAGCLDEVADLLETQGANRFRVRAYHSAALTVRGLEQEAHAILKTEGVEGLLRLPGIGRSLARAIDQLARTGRLGLLQRLRGESGPEHLFLTLPGIGREMANRLHEHLGAETLQEVEAAAYDGRLARVPGMGPKRLRAIRESLAGRFRRPLRTVELHPARPMDDEPTVQELLDVDREYREQAQAGRLPRIAPQRFNPTGQAWLPVLHTQRGDRHYTALYSNTARAHELGMTHDWVVIYRDDHDGHGQWTAVTARFGGLRGRRIIRGREPECAAHYARPAERKREDSLFPV